jgi:glycosyltransferase involved in cell wall biosynthesis
MKIGIATTFSDLRPTYSLATVVKDQLKALLKHGYTPVLLTLPSFDDEVPAGVEVRKVVPQIILEPYAGRDPEKLNEDQVAEDVERVFNFFVEHCADLDVIITHDWMLVDTYAPYAAAIQMANKSVILRRKKWFHWIHSHPGLYEEYPYPWSAQSKIPVGHKIVYLNNTDVVSVFERFQGKLDDVRVVHNPTDPRSFFNLHPLTHYMIDALDLLNSDIMQTYPVSTPRMIDGKQVHKVIALFAKLKAEGHRVKLVVCNAHANADKDKELIKQMVDYATSVGLSDKEVIFTSLLQAPAWEQGVPHEVVRDLFLLSNLFFFPTVSENAPLILLEAAAAKNLLVLNEDFLPLREFFGEDALYFKFSSLRTQTTYTDEGKYFEDVAKIVAAELDRHRAFRSFNTWKQRFNYDYIFLHEFEPLLLEGKEPDGL